MDTLGMEDVSDAGLWSLLSWMASCFMVFGGVIPYVPQYKDIQRTNNADGFSTWVCLVLLMANILRIFFWCGKFFEVTLLVQSIVMIVTMLAMLDLCCSVQSINQVSSKRRFFTDFDLQYFWKWSRFVDYLQFCLCVSVVCTFVTYIFIDAAIFVEGLGFVAVLMEAMLGIPQLWQNFQKHSTHGMSVAMVLLWTAGDTFKTAYFIINESPVQFWLCGTLQICIDIAILIQVYAYDLQTHSKYG